MNICIFCKTRDVGSFGKKFCSHECYSKSLIGSKQSTETIKKRISKLIGSKRTPKQRSNMSLSMIGIKKKVKHDGQFKKGNIPWTKGRSPSNETRKKISQSQIGKKISEETKLKISRANSGEKSYLWKGGITPQNKIERVKFKNQIQKKVLERDEYTCQICFKKGGQLQVDHIQEWNEFVELRFDINNCRTLCMGCHYQITFGKPMPLTIKTWGHNLVNKNIKYESKNC